MKKWQQKEYEVLLEYREKGYFLLPMTLKTICQAYDYDPQMIGQHFLGVLASYQSSGDLDDIWEDQGLILGDTIKE